MVDLVKAAAQIAEDAAALDGVFGPGLGAYGLRCYIEIIGDWLPIESGLASARIELQKTIGGVPYLTLCGVDEPLMAGAPGVDVQPLCRESLGLLVTAKAVLDLVHDPDLSGRAQTLFFIQSELHKAISCRQESALLMGWIDRM